KCKPPWCRIGSKDVYVSLRRSIVLPLPSGRGKSDPWDVSPLPLPPPRPRGRKGRGFATATIDNAGFGQGTGGGRNYAPFHCRSCGAAFCCVQAVTATPPKRSSAWMQQGR